MHRKLIPFLIALNLIWSAAAFTYDAPEIFRIPFYLWPFIVICPVYPFLLALVWCFIKKEQLNSILLSFAAIPSAIYFLASLVYYPTWMMLNGFDWLALGQIFWVTFYGIQGLYLIQKYTPAKSAIILACLFLVISFGVQYFVHHSNDKNSYIDYTNFSSVLLLGEYVFLVTATLVLSLALYTKKNNSSTRIINNFHKINAPLSDTTC